MKKTISALCIFLFSLTALHPVGSLICSFFGYEFSFSSYEIYAVIMLLIVSAALIMSIKSAESSKAADILLIILPPLSFINGMIFLIKNTTLFTAVCMLVYFTFCCVLTLKISKSLVIKHITATLSCLMVAPVAFLISLYFLFGPFVENTTVKTVDSPSGSYYAEIEDFDQGALGGDTLVYVYEAPVIDIFIFRVQKSPQLIYTGEWGEYKDMNIYWTTDNCLVIGSKKYYIE